jgi:hypothetical protein
MIPRSAIAVPNQNSQTLRKDQNNDGRGRH